MPPCGSKKKLLQEIRNSERQVDDILKHRKIEEARVQLVRSVFETARERAKREAEGCRRRPRRTRRRRTRCVSTCPSCRSFVLPSLSRGADRARKACLGALKDRLLERANIIQGRLDTENANLAKRQAAFQRTRDRMEEAMSL